MKNSQKLAGITVLLILTFMVVALAQYQEEEGSTSLLPEQAEYYYNEDWCMVALDDMEVTESEPESQGKVLQRLKNALAEGNYQEINLPYKENNKTSDMIAFNNTFPSDYAGLTMNFPSTNAKVRVILDGEVIYQYGFSDENISGNHENFVDIPKVFHDGEVWIELTSSNPDAAFALGNIKIETRDVVVIGVVGNRITDIGCCLLIIIMAIIMFVLALIRKHTDQPSRGELFLGLAGVAAGIYCFIWTNTLSLFYNMQEAYVLQEYLAMLILLFLALYFDRNLHMTFPRRFTALLWCVSTNAVLQILLQALQIRKLEDMVGITAGVAGLLCLTAIISLLQFDYRNRHYQTILSVLSLLVLLSGGIINIINNIIYKDEKSYTAIQYSIALFGIIVTAVHILQLSKEYRANAEENARLLEEK